MKLNPINTIVFFGIFQNLVVIILILFTKKWKEPHNLILVSISVVLCLFLIPFFIGNTELIFQNDDLRFLPLDLSLFLFPLLYFYFSIVFQENFKLGKKKLLHLVIPFGFWIYHFIVWLSTLPVANASKQQIAISLYFFQIQSLHHITLVVIAGFYGYLSIRLFRQGQSDHLTKDQIRFSRWLQFLLVILSIGFLLDLSSVVIGKYYGYWKGSPFDHWLGIPFSSFVKIYYAASAYFIALIGYSRFTKIKTRGTSSSRRDISEYIPRIIKLMEEKKRYLNPNLTLKSIAEELNTTPSVISAILNNEIKMSYSDFVNNYRVQEVKGKLLTDMTDRFTLLGLAKDSGFKSKTTFYRAFQKFEQQSPKSYIKNIKGEN